MFVDVQYASLHHPQRRVAPVRSVAVDMEPLVLFGQMELSVRIEVAAHTQRAQLEDRFGALEAPARAGDLHAVAHAPSTTPVAIGSPSYRASSQRRYCLYLST